MTDDDEWPACPECGGVLNFSGRCGGCDWWGREANEMSGDSKTTECWRCGEQRYTYESCHHCGGSCKPLTKRKQREENGQYMWRVPAKSSSELRGSDYSAYLWERKGAKPTILFPRRADAEASEKT